MDEPVEPTNRIECGGNMHDRDGWTAITCAERDAQFSEQLIEGVYGVSSTLTDPEGVYGPAVVYTEWHVDNRPVLRDYRWCSSEPCEHYVPA